MRILLVSPFFPPQNSTASVRVHAFAKYWARDGEDVTVLTTAKRKDQGGLELPCEGFQVMEVAHRGGRWLEPLRRKDRELSGADHGNGAAAHIEPSWFRRLRRLREQTGIYNAVRMPDVTDSWVKPALEWALEQEPWDVVVSSAGPYTAHLVALELKKRRLAGLWAADYRDLWTENHAFSGLFPFTVREKLLERECHRQADLLTTVSPALARRLASRSRKPLEVIFNGHDEDLSRMIPAEPAFPDDGILRLVYTGTLYPRRQDAAPLLEALRALLARPSPPPLRLVIAGPGREEWSRLARSHRVDGALEHRGVVSHVQALRLQRDASALVLFDWNEPGDGVMTTKLFEYLFSRAPVLLIGASSGSPVLRVLEETRRGAWVGRTSAEARAHLERLIAGSLPAVSTPDRESVRPYTREVQSLRLLGKLRAMLDESRPVTPIAAPTAP